MSKELETCSKNQKICPQSINENLKCTFVCKTKLETLLCPNIRRNYYYNYLHFCDHAKLIYKCHKSSVLVTTGDPNYKL